MSLLTVLLAFMCFLSLISTQNSNLYPNCAIIDLVNKKCLQCTSEKLQIFEDQCVAISSVTQPISTSNTKNQNLPTTTIFYNQPNTNQDTQSVYQNQAVTQIPQPALVTASSNSQSSNYANIFNILSYFSSNSQNSQLPNQPSDQSNIFLPFFMEQTQKQPAQQPLQKGTYSDSNCEKTDETNTRCLRCYKSYYVNQTLQKCVPLNPLCQNVTDQNICTSCYIGYMLDHGNCVINANYQPSNSNTLRDDNCKMWDNGICKQCYSGYYLNTGAMLCKLVDPLCKTNNNEGKCTNCYPGYQVNSTQGCSVKKESSSSSTNTNAQSFTAVNSNINSNINGNLQTNVKNTNLLTGSNMNTIASSILGISNSASQSNCFNVNQFMFCLINNFICQFKIIEGQKQLVNVIAIDGATSNPNSQSNTGSGIQTLLSSLSQTPQSSSSPSSLSSTLSSFEVNSNKKCDYRKVYINGKCQSVSNDCKEWDQLGKCTKCYGGYGVVNGECKIN